MKKIYNTTAFTLVELVVSIVITVTLLGGVLYFITDVLVSLTESQNEVEFISDFQNFIDIANSSSATAIVDNLEGSGSDVIQFTSTSIENNSNGYYIMGVVDDVTRKLTSSGAIGQYSKRVLGYKYFDKNYIDNLVNFSDLYDATFREDELFMNMNIKNIQLQTYTSPFGNFNDIEIETFSEYQDFLEGEDWISLDQSGVSKYYISLAVE